MILKFIFASPLFISALVGLVLYKKLNSGWLRQLTWFLVLTSLNTIFSAYYSSHFHKSNHFIANGYTLLQFPFYFWMFYITLQTKRYRKLTIWATVAFFIVAIISYLTQSFFVFNSTLYTFGGILTIVFCLLYFVSLFRSDEFINYFTIPMFWISTGLLFFFAGNVVYFSLVNYLIKNGIDKNGNIFLSIMVTLHSLLYGLICIGLFCNLNYKQWKTKM